MNFCALQLLLRPLKEHLTLVFQMSKLSLQELEPFE